MTRLTVFKPRSLVSILMFTTVWAVGSASASTLDLEAQRAQYDKAQRWLDERMSLNTNVFVSRSIAIP